MAVACGIVAGTFCKMICETAKGGSLVGKARLAKQKVESRKQKLQS